VFTRGVFYHSPKLRTKARPLILAQAAVALAAAVSSLYVHYQMLQDPLTIPAYRLVVGA
jgi:hypothetical protein